MKPLTPRQGSVLPVAVRVGDYLRDAVVVAIVRALSSREIVPSATPLCLFYVSYPSLRFLLLVLSHQGRHPQATPRKGLGFRADHNAVPLTVAPLEFRAELELVRFPFRRVADASACAELQVAVQITFGQARIGSSLRLR